MKQAFIGLGSNLDQPIEQLNLALDNLKQHQAINLVTYSNYYENPAMGDVPQPDYVNAVAEITTELTPDNLLHALQSLEQQQGRVRGPIRWSARTLDLDLLLFEKTIMNTEFLTLPHSGLRQRNFVLYPLYEIAPNLILPGDNMPLAKLIENCSAEGLTRLTQHTPN